MPRTYGGIAPHEFVHATRIVGSLLSCGDLLAEHCTPGYIAPVFCPRTMVQPIQSLTVAGDCLDCLLPLHETSSASGSSDLGKHGLQRRCVVAHSPLGRFAPL